MGPPATLLVLAGGRSRRMGRPKALLPVGGTTLVEWLVARLAPGFAGVAVAAGPEIELPAALERFRVADRRPGAGPLAGIEAGLAVATTELAFALACDMPYVEPGLAARLLAVAPGHDAAVPRVGGRPEPACAVYSRSAAGAIGVALDAGRRRAADVLGTLDVAWVEDEEPGQFASLNSPAEYDAFLAALRKTG